jgi:hypothetical protein
MAVNVMDTAVQLTRASIAGGYGVASMFSDEDLDVRKSDLYNWFTTKGIKLKSNNTSMSRELCKMGFGSLEAALTTTADVATDCISWWTWTSRWGLQELLMADFLERLYKSTKQSGRNVSKGY